MPSTEIVEEFEPVALVVDDQFVVRKLLSDVLVAEGWEVVEAESVAEAEEILASRSFPLIFLDKVLKDGGDGLVFLKSIKERKIPGEVALITGQGCLSDALFSFTAGALTYLPKPFTNEDVVEVLRRVEDMARQGSSGDLVVIPAGMPEFSLVGEGRAMTKVIEAIHRYAATDVPVFIMGATGTGKELVAREFHRHSNRSMGPFIPINCGALPVTLIEAELFGSVKGAFTDAVDRTGLLQEADGGTVFLDEITETTPAFQVKLLRAIQEMKIRRVGSNRTIDIDVRVIAATNGDVYNMVEEGRFRPDLFYRLEGCMVQIPALVKRPEDINLLVQHFISKAAQRLGREITCPMSLIKALARYSWPGNVRELEQAISTAAVACRGGLITFNDMPDKIRRALGEVSESGEATVIIGTREDHRRLEEVERDHIRGVLASTKGNLTAAARILGIDRSTLRRKVRGDESIVFEEEQEQEPAVAAAR